MSMRPGVAVSESGVNLKKPVLDREIALGRESNVSPEIAIKVMADELEVMGYEFTSDGWQIKGSDMGSVQEHYSKKAAELMRVHGLFQKSKQIQADAEWRQGGIIGTARGQEYMDEQIRVRELQVYAMAVYQAMQCDVRGVRTEL